MTVYPVSSFPARVIWPNPIEPIWQALPTYSPIALKWKRTDIELSDRLFIGAVVNIPKEERSWGIMNWLAETFQVSRPTLYTIGEQAKSGLLWAPSQASAAVAAAPAATGGQEKMIAVTSNRVKRTALSLVLPGGVAERPIRDCLQAAFDEGRCPGSVSALIHEAGGVVSMWKRLSE